jgi:hypothetical protein
MSRRMRWVGHIQHMARIKNVYKIVVRKPKGKRLLGKPRHRWKY